MLETAWTSPLDSPPRSRRRTSWSWQSFQNAAHHQRLQFWNVPLQSLRYRALDHLSSLNRMRVAAFCVLFRHAWKTLIPPQCSLALKISR
jgi:hypothetical protein